MRKARQHFKRLQWAALMISSIWRGTAARREVEHERLMRDATCVIFFHMRRWIKRRRRAKLKEINNKGLKELSVADTVGLEDEEECESLGLRKLSVKEETAKRFEKELASKRLLMQRQKSAHF